DQGKIFRLVPPFWRHFSIAPPAKGCFMKALPAMTLLALLLPAIAHAGEPNTWARLDKATIVGRRWDVPLGYDPVSKQFIVLGGRSNYGDYKKPRSYDVLTLTAGKEWENAFP